MMELKRKINEIFKNSNQAWVETIKKGAEEGGISLEDMFSINAQHIEDLNTAFMEFEERGKGKKKGWGN